MHALTELRAFSEGLKEEMVLSAYIPRESVDAGAGAVWRQRFDAAAAAARPAEADQHLPFDAALGHIKSAMASLGRVLPNPGWVVFATSDRVLYSGALLHAPPSLAAWRPGPTIGPYVPSLMYEGPLTAVVLDQRRARLFTHQGGLLTEVASVEADAGPFDEVGSGMRKGAGTATGVRGATRTDAAQQAHNAAENKYLRAVAEAALKVEGPSEGVAVGGSVTAVASVRRILSEISSVGVVELNGTSMRDSVEKLLSPVENARGAIQDDLQMRLATASLNAGSGNGTGWDNVLRSLHDGAVDTLLVCEEILSSEAGEELARLAMFGGSDVQVVRNDAADLLREEADGVAATLRFTVAPAP